MNPSTALPVISVPPAVRTHVVKGLLAGATAILLGLLSYALASNQETEANSESVLLIAGLFVIPAVLLALVTVRNVRALFVRPSLVLTPDGFQLTSWNGVSFTGMFLPHYQMTTRVIAWEDLRQTLVFSRSVNLITMVQELRLTTSQGLLVFGWDVFRPSVTTLQRMLLDYLDELQRAPLRPGARLGEFQRRRWVTPLELPGGKQPAWLAGLCWLGVAVFLAIGFIRGWEGDWPGFMAFVSAFGGFSLTRSQYKAGLARHLVLGTGGLAVGASAAKCEVIPWDRIRFARPHTREDSSRGATAAIDRVEIRLDDGRAVMVDGRADHEYRRLLALLEPDLKALPAVWERLARGEAIEAAVAAEGLQARG
jgi:hypothetical protein